MLWHGEPAGCTFFWLKQVAQLRQSKNAAPRFQAMPASGVEALAPRDRNRDTAN